MARAKRFYKTARVSEDGLGVRLDARALRTPGGRVFVAPSRALTEAIAAEWDRQGAAIVPASMPLTQLAFAALDGGEAARAERVAYVVKFGETDLCCHRADVPAALAAHQAATWDPLVAWGQEALGVSLNVVIGVLPAPDATALAGLAAHAQALDDFRLTALAQTAGLTGSALLAFALVQGEIGAAEAFAAAALDDLWSLQHWGEDEEARGKLDRQRAEFQDISRFIAALM